MDQIWETPELVILVQGRNDERVLLTGCKGNNGDGPDSNNDSCLCEECCPCETQGQS